MTLSDFSSRTSVDTSKLHETNQTSFDLQDNCKIDAASIQELVLNNQELQWEKCVDIMKF